MRRFAIAALCALAAFASPVLAMAGEAPQATTLDTIVVVGSRAPEPLRQVVGSVTAIEYDQLERNGVANIADLARLVPGLEVPADPVRFGAQGYNLRGLEGNRVSVEVDGVPLPDGFGVGQFSLAGRDLLDLGVVQRVEVLRGPASTQYGSKALAGVVAYTTRTPEDYLWNRGALAVGATAGISSRDDSHVASGRVAWADGAWSGLVALVRREGHETDNHPRSGGMRANPADTRRDGVLAKLVWDGGSMGRGTFTLDRGAGRQKTDVASLVGGPGRYATTSALLADDKWHRNRASIDTVWSTPVAGIDSLDLLIYRQEANTSQATDQYRQADRTTPYATLRRRDFDYRQRSLGMKLVAQSRTEWLGLSHWNVFGLDLTRHDYRGLRDGAEINLENGASTNVVLGEVFPVRDFPNSRVREAGVFWQDEMRIGSHWALVPGLRYEHYQLDAYRDAIWLGDNPDTALANVETSRWTPKLGLRFSSGRHATLYLQAVRGFRAPPFSDVNIGLYLPALNYVVRPNPHLRPETSRGLETGLRWQSAAFEFSLALYDNRFRDLIETRVNLGTDPDSGALVFQSVNRARARIRGAELEARWHGGAWRPSWEGWFAELRASTSRGDDTVRRQPLNSVQPARATFGLGRESSDGSHGAELLVTGVRRVRRVDESAGPLYRPAGYARWDANVWWRSSGKLRVNFVLGNLGNRRYYDWMALRGVVPGARDLDLYLAPGRYASLNIMFDG